MNNDAKHDDFVTEIYHRVRAGTPILWIVTTEPDRAIPKIQEAVQIQDPVLDEDGNQKTDESGALLFKFPKLNTLVWDAARGLQDYDDEFKQILTSDEMTGETQTIRRAIAQDEDWAGRFSPTFSLEPIEDEEDLTLDSFQYKWKESIGDALRVASCKETNRVCVILRDFDQMLGEPRVIPMIQTRTREYKRTGSVIIILTSSTDIPQALKPVDMLKMELPTKADFQAAMDTILANVPEDRQKEFLVAPRDKIAQSMLGLTYAQSENALAYVGRKEKCWNPDALSSYKSSLFNQDGILEFIDVKDTLADFGGYKNLVNWLNMIVDTWTPEAFAFGNEYPKGLLMFGPPGTGKTMMAQIIGTMLGLPVVIVHFEQCYDKWVGGTEANVNRLIQMLRAVGPCLIIFDEGEKIFAGTSTDSASSNDVSKRAMGPLLGFMDRPHPDQYIAVTSNDPRPLPPEFSRSGRLDRVVRVGPPNLYGREEILKIHMAKRCNKVNGFNAENFDMAAVADVTEGFSGADLRELIINAFRYSWVYEDGKMNTDTLIKVSENVKPCTILYKERIEQIDRWAADKDIFDASEEIPMKVLKERQKAAQTRKVKKPKKERAAHIY